jgi:hypothetical protein
MVFNATFNNISWWSVLLVEETGAHRENHRPAASHWQTLSHNVVSSTPHHEQNSNFSDNRYWLHRHSCKGCTCRFPGYSSFLHIYNWPPRYTWNIFASIVNGTMQTTSWCRPFNSNFSDNRYWLHRHSCKGCTITMAPFRMWYGTRELFVFIYKDGHVWYDTKKFFFFKFLAILHYWRLLAQRLIKFS